MERHPVILSIAGSDCSGGAVSHYRSYRTKYIRGTRCTISAA